MLIRKIAIMLGVLGTLLGGAFVFNTVAAVTMDDVTSHFSLGRPQATVGVAGGDIYAISPDGQSETRLCSLNLREDFVTRVRVDAQFSNTIGATLPFLVKFVSFGADDGITGAGDFDGARLRFSGEFTELQPDAPVGASASCERRMAQYLNRRHKICMVRSSLVPADATVFSAYRFDQLQIHLPDALFPMYDLIKSDAAREVQQLDCPQESALPWDVAFRKSLRVISMEALEDDPAI